MTGPLFDPSRMAVRREREQAQAADPAGTSGRAAPLTVSALSTAIDAAVRAGVPQRVRVIGEVSGFRERTHWYFDLKDAASCIGCVMFASAAARSRVRPEDGQEVLVTGRVEYYARQGRVSIITDTIEPVGAGALDLALRALIEDLRSRGYLDPARKRPLPLLPRRIGVVTSRSAAALQDVLVTMRKRCPAVGVVLADVRVQGEGASSEVARAIASFSRHHARLGIDAVLVTRGGGSKEDLWAFNEREVADAIVHCRVPVVAAIGHETDVTVAELVADERCATPTQAAMRLAPDTAALLRQIHSSGRRLGGAMARAGADGRAALTASARALSRAVSERRHDGALAVERAGARLERQRPGAVLARLGERLHAAQSRVTAAARGALARADLDGLASRLRRACGTTIPALAARLDAGERQLEAVSPLRVLERGYSVTTRRGGGIVRSVRDVRPGETLSTRVADGHVESTAIGSGTPLETRTPPARRRREPETGPGLFGAAP